MKRILLSYNGFICIFMFCISFTLYSDELELTCAQLSVMQYLAYFNVIVDRNEIESMITADTEILMNKDSAWGIIKLLEKKGIKTICVSMENKEDLRKFTPPYILHVSPNHFVFQKGLTLTKGIENSLDGIVILRGNGVYPNIKFSSVSKDRQKLIFGSWTLRIKITDPSGSYAVKSLSRASDGTVQGGSVTIPIVANLYWEDKGEPPDDAIGDISSDCDENIGTSPFSSNGSLLGTSMDLYIPFNGQNTYVSNVHFTGDAVHPRTGTSQHEEKISRPIFYPSQNGNEKYGNNNPNGCCDHFADHLKDVYNKTIISRDIYSFTVGQVEDLMNILGWKPSNSNYNTVRSGDFVWQSTEYSPTYGAGHIKIVDRQVEKVSTGLGNIISRNILHMEHYVSSEGKVKNNVMTQDDFRNAPSIDSNGNVYNTTTRIYTPK